jgi:hypothetical protein
VPVQAFPQGNEFGGRTNQHGDGFEGSGDPVQNLSFDSPSIPPFSMEGLAAEKKNSERAFTDSQSQYTKMGR